MGSTCPDDGAFLLVLSHGPRRLFLTQWPRQYFHTTCVKFGRSLATPQCRWGMDARVIRSETLCVFRGRFHPSRWKGQLAVSAEAGAPDCRGCCRLCREIRGPHLIRHLGRPDTSRMAPYSAAHRVCVIFCILHRFAVDALDPI